MKSLVKSWLKSQPDECRSNLENWLGDYFSRGLEWVLKQVRTLRRTSLFICVTTVNLQILLSVFLRSHSSSISLNVFLFFVLSLSLPIFLPLFLSLLLTLFLSLPLSLTCSLPLSRCLSRSLSLSEQSFSHIEVKGRSMFTLRAKSSPEMYPNTHTHVPKHSFTDTHEWVGVNVHVCVWARTRVCLQDKG